MLPKQFTGSVWNSILNLIPIAKVPDTAEVWVCEPVDILSEFRAYIHYGEMIVARWFEIMAQGGKSKTLKENLGAARAAEMAKTYI